MTIANMLDLAASRKSAWFNLWQLYFLMTSTVLIVVSASPSPILALTAGVLCGLVGLAAIGFATAFWSSYDARVAIAHAIDVMARDESEQHANLARQISQTLQPRWRKCWWVLTYSLYSIAVLILTWCIPSSRRSLECCVSLS